MCNTLQDSLLSQSAISSSITAFRGKVEKDVRHKTAVQAAGGIFIPLVMEMLGR